MHTFSTSVKMDIPHRLLRWYRQDFGEVGWAGGGGELLPLKLLENYF